MERRFPGVHCLPRPSGDYLGMAAVKLVRYSPESRLVAKVVASSELRVGMLNVACGLRSRTPVARRRALKLLKVAFGVLVCLVISCDALGPAPPRGFLFGSPGFAECVNGLTKVYLNAAQMAVAWFVGFLAELQLTALWWLGQSRFLHHFPVLMLCLVTQL